MQLLYVPQTNFNHSAFLKSFKNIYGTIHSCASFTNDLNYAIFTAVKNQLILNGKKVVHYNNFKLS